MTQLLTARTFLQTDKPHARHAGQRREAGQRDRAPVILAIQAAPLPGDADLEAVEWGELALPLFGQAGTGLEVGRAWRNIFQRRGKEEGQAEKWSVNVELRQRRALGN